MQADLSVVAPFFRNPVSGLVHLDAVQKEFQLEIKPLPVMSNSVRESVLPRLKSLSFIEC